MPSGAWPIANAPEGRVIIPVLDPEANPDFYLVYKKKDAGFFIRLREFSATAKTFSYRFN